jgi:IS5 family transposase
LVGNRTPRKNIDLVNILGVSERSPMSMPDFLRSRLDSMIDLRHPLAVLATRMSWASIEATLAPMLERRSRDGRMSEAVDLF